MSIKISGPHTCGRDIFILMYLKNHNNRAYPKEMSSEFRVSTARIAVILNRLEKNGCVSRCGDENDSRQTIVTLSEKGERLICDKYGEAIETLSNILRLLGPEDAREYVRLIKKLGAAAGEFL